MTPKAAAALALAAAVCALAACTTPAQAPAPVGMGPVYLPGMEGRTPDAGGTLRRALPGEPATLNPVVANDALSYQIYKLVFDPLIDTGKDLKPVGVLAESWTVGPDKKSYTVKLRKGATWHDGKPVTADDVLFTLAAIRDEKVDSGSKRASFQDVAVTKVDAQTVRFVWKEPYAPALTELVLYIIPKHVYGYPAGQGDALNKNPRNAQPVGSGPYKFVEWKRGESITLEANPAYWRGRPHLDKVLVKIIPQLQTENSAFLTGALDLTRLTPDAFDKYRADAEFKKKYALLEYPVRNFFYLGWNLDGSNPFFQDKRVRQAMTYALNRAGIVEKVLKGHALLCTGPGSPGSWNLDPGLKPYPYDPKKAAALLEEAGWKDTDGDGVRDKGGKPFEFEVLYPQEAGDFQRFLEFFQQDLRKVGVRMTLRPLEYSVFMGRTDRHQFQAVLNGFAMGDDPNPHTLFHSSQAKLLPTGEGAGDNDGSYVSAEADRLLDAQLRATDFKERQKLLWQLHALLAEDQPLTFLFTPMTTVAVSNRLQAVEASPGYGLFIWYPGPLDWWIPKEKQ